MKTPASFDFETHLFRDGMLTPKPVCASWKVLGSSAEMATREAAMARLKRFLLDPTILIVGARIVYDLGVAAAEDSTLLSLIFDKLADNGVSCVQIRQALGDIAEGMLGTDRTTGGPIKGHISMAYLAKLHLNLDISKDKNDPNSPRLRYSEMEGKTLEEYPEEFVTYSLGDADHELDVYLKQQGYANLDREFDEIRADWCLYLMSIWGMRTDPVMVEKLAAELTKEYKANCKTFLKAGLYKVVTCKLKPLKEGQTERVREAADEITEEMLKTAPQDAKWLPGAIKAVKEGKAVRFGEDSKVLEQMVLKAYMGEPPRSEKGSVKCDRDTLMESGDELLEAYGDSTNTVKLLKTYIPVLRSGTKCPINPKFNILVDSLRTSCGDPNIQNLPR